MRRRTVRRGGWRAWWCHPFQDGCQPQLLGITRADPAAETRRNDARRRARFRLWPRRFAAPGRLTNVIAGRSRVRDGCRVGVTTPTHRAIVEVERLLARPIVAPPTELDDLVGHIIDVHHASARQWLAVLGQLVAGAEISRLPGGSALQRTVARVTAILAPHLAKEERVVFPYMRRLGDPAPARARFASLAQPLRQLD
ncbi:MAG: hypothetical protein F9K40_17995, partial [Kofleriaceae bacterium]